MTLLHNLLQTYFDCTSTSYLLKVVYFIIITVIACIGSACLNLDLAIIYISNVEDFGSTLFIFLFLIIIKSTFVVFYLISIKFVYCTSPYKPYRVSQEQSNFDIGKNITVCKTL